MSGRGRKANISYVKPPEPAFLKRLKEKVGFKEGPTVDTKKQELDKDEDEDERKVEKDDEKPVVVVLQAGDLSQEEAERIVDKLREAEEKAEEKVEKDTRITFKKPGKRSSSTEETNTSSTSKKAKATPLPVPPKRPGAEGDSKQINNRSLLSFDDQEDDD